MSNFRKKLGIEKGNISLNIKPNDTIKYINFKLASLGLPIYQSQDNSTSCDSDFLDLFEDIINGYKEKNRIVSKDDIGIHRRINAFFKNYFNEELKVPSKYFSLDHYGVARELSLPANGSEFKNEYLESYRIKQGVLHNPKNDKRTTKGSFHIVDGDLKIPFSKKIVPKQTFIKLYEAAVNPPEELKIIPFTYNQEKKAKTFLSLLVKPKISPNVPGVLKEKTMEVLYIAPGSMASSLDFVESVFGNAGDQSLHFNNSGIDVDNWSGHTGYVILAPHLPKIKKIDVGLPHKRDATIRQIRDGMFYESEDELYNDGLPFKLTCRDKSGVAVTIIADNYFGYSKKEVKTQISFAANLYGGVEEEHAGGTIVFPRYTLGEYYKASMVIDNSVHSFEEIKKIFGDVMSIKEENYGIDKQNPGITYLPENVEIDIQKSNIKWEYNGIERNLLLSPEKHYILPNGFKINLEKHPIEPVWKLVLTMPEGVFCHKPCTVSGGGKSEISKSINNSIVYGSYFVNDLEEDFNYVERILNYDYSSRWPDKPPASYISRKILSTDRTLGSVIKLLTPSTLYNDEYNKYVTAIPNHIKALLFLVKRFYVESWIDDWRSLFNVEIINGKPGNEIKYNNRKIRPSHLRVGFDKDKAWRVFKLRMDFNPSEKIQMEDDISSSTLIPANRLEYIKADIKNTSLKFVENCEYRFFQRPDEAIIKGYDKKAEEDLSSNNLFATNYQPLTKEDAQRIKDDVLGYVNFTAPVKKHIEEFLNSEFKYCIVSSNPRIVNGKPSTNPRYLEYRDDFVNPIKNYIAEIGVRFARKIPLDKQVVFPVNSILPGRMNNPPQTEDGMKILPLSVYNPIHYQELPELFMDYISSLTGKSPSTTGAGSEGALTKDPFNMLLAVYDLNSALLSYILGDYSAFSTPGGYIGENIQVDHDISILIPELWARFSEEERNPKKLIKEKSLEKIEDFEYNGKKIMASRLGYRITERFLYEYFGKIFDEPKTVFTEDILRPETQNLEAFVDGITNITEGHKKSSMEYFEDGSIEEAIEPIRAILNIMAFGEYKGKDINSNEVRDLFKKENVLNSDWYNQRLINKQLIDIKILEKKINNLEEFIANPVNIDINEEYEYLRKLETARNELIYFKSEEYFKSLVGTLGAEDIMLR